MGKSKNKSPVVLTVNGHTMGIASSYMVAKFIKEYVKRPDNPIEALKRAGYSDKHNNLAIALTRLFGNPEVRTAISEAMAVKLGIAGLTDCHIIDRLWKEANNFSSTGSAGARVASLKVLAESFKLIKANDTTQSSNKSNTVNIARLVIHNGELNSPKAVQPQVVQAPAQAVQSQLDSEADTDTSLLDSPDAKGLPPL